MKTSAIFYAFELVQAAFFFAEVLHQNVSACPVAAHQRKFAKAWPSCATDWP
jgi:hypothetical protein